MGKKKALFFGNKGIIPLENIISEWKFEDNVLDTVGNNNGINYGVDYVNGLVGKAGSFADIQPSPNRVIIDNPTGLSFTNNVNDLPFSVSLLFFAKSLQSANRILVRSNLDGTFLQYLVDIVNSKLRIVLVDVYFDDMIIFETENSVNTSTWYSASFVYDGTEMKIYINGDSQNIIRTDIGNYICMKNTTPTDLALGHNYVNNSSNYRGYLDCIRFWNKELSSEEVLEIATKELNGIDINP